jgi:DNA segregation ATPase FtsK/SpoIIIE-like protein
MAQAQTDAQVLDSAKPSRKAPDPVQPGKRHDLRAEMVGLVLLFAGAGFAAALISYSPRDMELIQTGRAATEGVHNYIGPVGARIADLLLQLTGLGAFLLAALVLVLAFRTLTGRMAAPKARAGLGIAGATLALLMLLHLGAQSMAWRPYGKDASGLIPGAIAVLCKALLSTTGTAMLSVWLLATSVAAITGRSLTRALFTWSSGRAAPVVDSLANSGAQAAKSSFATLRSGVSSTLAWRPQRSAASKLKDLDDSDFDLETPGQEVHFTVGELQQLWDGPSEPPPSQPAEVKLSVPAPTPLADTAVLKVAAPIAPSEFPRGEAMLPRAEHVPTAVRRAKERDQQDAPTEANVRVRLTDIPNANETFVHPAHALEVGPSRIDPATTARMNVADVRIAFADLDGMKMPVAEEDLAPLGDQHIAALVGDVEQELPPPVPATHPGFVRAEAERMTSPLAAALERPVVPGGPRIVLTEALRNAPTVAPTEAVQGELNIHGKAWVLPPSTLVQEPPARVVNCDAAMLRENAAVLEQKLAEFNIQGEVTDIRPGPVVTTYEFRPAPGIKISRIVNLRDDLTMSLSALRVRIVAPIPGRDVVGIEVPNHARQIVYFREVVDSPVFRESGSPLTLILGKDIEGRPICTDLARAPHLLVAGATGTGKSVGINTFICSMLFRGSPDDVKFIFIDPKILELSVYEGIPHLLLPVLDEPRKAELALKWAVQEMDRRYKLLSEVEVRNLAGYKAKLPDLRAQALRKRALAARPDMDGMVSDEEIPLPEDMPYIVVVIDEFADLIMAAGKEVEIPVARLAQKARAAGIHVILATQRPSVDVITGLIKANFPTRLSFQVASSMDSKVILGMVGAETLLGKGDLLFVPPGEGHLRRAHGTWISDEEVVAIARHWKDQGAPKYDMDILRDPEIEAASAEDDAEMDPLYDDAIRIAVEANQASVSFLQRKLGIGYGRSARIIDTMERRGVVGPSRGPNKPREILVNAL